MKKLNEALIVLDADVETAEDCIRLAGEMFEKNGYVNTGYADAVVEREKNTRQDFLEKESILQFLIPTTSW